MVSSTIKVSWTEEGGSIASENILSSLLRPYLLENMTKLRIFLGVGYALMDKRELCRVHQRTS